MKKLIAALTLLSVGASSFFTLAADTNQFFERGALTPIQLNAWKTYVSTEAGIFGCEYGDDPRLGESPETLFNALADGTNDEPVMVTYRSLMNMGPNTRALLSNNIKVASMECNAVYYNGEELIGMPVIPFEEALTLLHDDLANYGDMQRIRDLNRTFVVAAMDPRWFWTFFIADRAHMDLLGYDFNTLVRVEQALSERDQPLVYEQDDYNLLSHIFNALNTYGVRFYGASGQCEDNNQEPAGDLIVWPELTDEIVTKFYRHHQILFKGKWKTKAKIEGGGITLYQASDVDNPTIPLFNVTRGLSIASHECRL